MMLKANKRPNGLWEFYWEGQLPRYKFDISSLVSKNLIKHLEDIFGEDYLWFNILPVDNTGGMSVNIYLRFVRDEDDAYFNLLSSKGFLPYVDF